MWAAGVLLAGLALAGCRSDGLRVGRRGDAVANLHLLGTPVAIDLDKKPGPDGLGVRVYASSETSPGAVRITSGTLELLLYDGTIRPQDLATLTPLATFSYSAQELKKVEHKTAVGVSYNFLPAWGAREPTKGRVTVLAAYKLPGKPVILSAPITVPIGKK